MSSIVRAVELQPKELEMLGGNVVHAVENDGEAELSAVNRSLAVHNESVAELVCPANGGLVTVGNPDCRSVRAGTSPAATGLSPRPAAW